MRVSCHCCPGRTPDDAAPPTSPAAVPGSEGHPPTAFESLRQVLHARSIESAHAASEDPAGSPIRAAWIIS
jgi:hypothetical protein